MRVERRVVYYFAYSWLVGMSAGAFARAGVVKRTVRTCAVLMAVGDVGQVCEKFGLGRRVVVAVSFVLYWVPLQMGKG